MAEFREEDEEEDRREGEGEGGRLCDGFLDRLSGLINRDNVNLVLAEQETMMETLEVANAKLSSLNDFSEKRFELYAGDFHKYTQTLTNMKRELDSVFRRIRMLKSRVAMQYPAAYGEVQAELQSELEEEEEEERLGEDQDR